MTVLRWAMALIGIVVAMVVIVEIPWDQPLGPATSEPSELTTTVQKGRWLDEDWEIFAAKVREADEAGIDSLSFGDAVATVGRSFVGTPYVPGTLEQDGPEHVVIDFRGLDCVTFVENTLALTRFVRTGGVRQLWDRPGSEARYESLLEDIRYRGGHLNGYPSRLHYFSEWIADNVRRGGLADLGDELDAVPDPEPIEFMSTHTDAYRQLADPALVERIRGIEAHLNETGRRYVPEDRIADVASRIQNGDVIAATSTVPGLDIAHTGLALRIDGRLHLLHAPLVGEAVQISELPLADRILDIQSQDGIMVARPLER